MKKSDLKTGMLVEMGDKTTRLVLGNTLIGFDGSKGGININNLTNDLRREGNTNDNIMQVYSEPYCNTGLCASLTYWIKEKEYKKYSTLLWERKPDVEEMTLEEVCKALGKNVKIIKG